MRVDEAGVRVIPAVESESKVTAKVVKTAARLGV